MGRRKKEDILTLPEEHDFEIRPREIIPEGYEHEVFQKLHGLLTQFGLQNPMLKFVVATDTGTYFRYDTIIRKDPPKDVLDRPIGEPKIKQMRIHATCIPLEAPLQEAELFDFENNEQTLNGWTDIEVEFKDTADPRMRRVLKYP